MWKVQSSLLPLLQCFPADTWHLFTETETPDIEDFSFTRHLKASDWERVILYGHKVKRLIEDEDGPDLWLPEDLGHILSAALPPASRYLLPELQEIYCPPSEEAYQFIRLLLPPTIRKIRIEMDYMEPLPFSCFYNLPQLCPEIEKIEILHTEVVPFLELGPALRFFASLRHLTLEDATAESVIYISRYLPQLTHLRLAFFFNLHKEPASYPPNTFPHLLHLQLANVGVKFAEKILSSISSTVLEHLSLFDVATSSEDRWDLVLSRLKSFRHSLRFLKLKESPIWGPIRYQVSQKGLTDVLTLHNLSHLLVTAEVTREISDDFLRDLSQNCPRLVAIKLWSRQGSLRPPKVTLNALSFLAQNCSRLSRIKFSLDARSVPDIPEPRTPPVNWAMDTLTVGVSPISTSVEVAAFLRHLFPRLKDIECQIVPPSEFRRLWRQTSLHLKDIGEAPG